MTTQPIDRKKRFLLSISTILLTSSAVIADVTLPAIINSQMVLQRDTKAPVWGWADAGEKISVSFAGQNKKAGFN